VGIFHDKREDLEGSPGSSHFSNSRAARRRAGRCGDRGPARGRHHRPGAYD
jgi:hypothetical protein